MTTVEPLRFIKSVTLCFVLVQQLLILQSTLSPARITVKGVPVLALLNQLPGSSVRLMVSTEPPDACTFPGLSAVSPSSASAVTQFNNEKFSLFIVIDACFSSAWLVQVMRLEAKGFAVVTFEAGNQLCPLCCYFVIPMASPRFILTNLT